MINKKKREKKTREYMFIQFIDKKREKKGHFRCITLPRVFAMANIGLIVEQQRFELECSDRPQAYQSP
jgi:hypothetical protein